MISVKGILSIFSNSQVDASQSYPDHLRHIASLEKSNEAIDVISQWPGYAATPLYSLEHLAKWRRLAYSLSNCDSSLMQWT